MKKNKALLLHIDTLGSAFAPLTIEQRGELISLLCEKYCDDFPTKIKDPSPLIEYSFNLLNDNILQNNEKYWKRAEYIREWKKKKREELKKLQEQKD